MPLDFAVLDESGAPEQCLPLGVALHQELLAAAFAHGQVIFHSFTDYYQDTQVAVADLPVFIEQTRMLRETTNSGELKEFLLKLEDLIAFATLQERSVHVLAD